MFFILLPNIIIFVFRSYNTVETLLEEKKQADDRIQSLKDERAKADQATEQLRKQMMTSKKEVESKMFKVEEKNDDLTHELLVMKMEKKEANDKVSALEGEINTAETAIGDAKNALQKLLVDKDEASRKIESLEEDFAHAQSTIDAMTKSMSQAREEYEAKIDSLMRGLATAREVHASRSMSGGQSEALSRSSSLALTRTETRSSAYTIPKLEYGKGDSFTGSLNNTTVSGSKTSALDENKGYTRSRSRGAYASATLSKGSVDHSEETLARKKELAVDMDNMTIASELTDRWSVGYGSSGRAKSAGRARSTGRQQVSASSYLRRESRSFHEDERDSAAGNSKQSSAVTPDTKKSADSKLSNLDLARTFLSESSGGNSTPASSRARSRSQSRSRLPQDRDAFDDAKSVGATSIKSRSSGKGFGGQYDGDLNSRGERHGYGTFIADNGNEYEGEWKSDKREGHGKAKYNTGDVFIGSWKNCKRHGHGTMYIENGDVYEGGWDNGFKDGVGTYRWRDGEVDVGRYSSDYRVGEGVRWSEDRKRAFRLVRGNVQEEIDLAEAERICDGLGLPIP